MRVFIDTEFLEDGETIRLISLGAVREDGEEYYAVVADGKLFEAACAHEWLRENVVAHLPLNDLRFLDGRHPDVKPRYVIRDEFRAFCGDDPEFWSYFADYDWVAIAQLFGRMIDLPSGWPMYCLDLVQELRLRGGQRPPKSDVEHHALADARWHRQLFDLNRLRWRL